MANRVDVIESEDSGSSSCKRVWLNAATGEFLGSVYVSNEGDPTATHRKLTLARMAEHPEWRPVRFWTTGSSGALILKTYGGDFHETEIITQGRGIAAVCSGIKMGIDIGGLDSKAITLKPNGEIDDFEMNAMCGAGTGGAISNMCHYAGLDFAGFNREALCATKSLQLNRRCSVLMTQGWIQLQAAGEEVPDRAKAFLESIAWCVIQNTVQRKLMLVPDTVAFVGKPAQQEGLRRALETALTEYANHPVKVVVPNKPKGVFAVTAAYGTALLALEDYRERGGGSLYRGVEGVDVPEGVAETCEDDPKCHNKCRVTRFYDPQTGALLCTTGRQCGRQ